MANPRIQYANKPHVYTKKFIMYVWLAFFTRHKPASTWRSRLHEHDEKAADEGPDEIDRDLVLTDLVRHIWSVTPTLSQPPGHH